MKIEQIVRAWKDKEYRGQLSTAEQAKLPAHPSGMIELTDADLGTISGGGVTANCGTRPTACGYTHALCTSPVNCPL